MAIRIVTEELRYLTWDEAMLCLCNSPLPDDLRAMYCKLIIGEVLRSLLIMAEIVNVCGFNSIIRRCPRKYLECREHPPHLRIQQITKL
jgi:hypothetical protein